MQDDTMVMEKSSVKKAPREPRNGVDTPTLLATINAVAGQPELAKFKFRAKAAGLPAPTAAARWPTSSAPAPSSPT
jgi:hypothetical protein